MTDLEQEYRERREQFLVPAAEKLELHLRNVFHGNARIDRISARAKAVGRFVQKALKEEEGKRKYTNPLSQIQDQIGARIVTFYAPDVGALSDHALNYLKPVE